MAPAACDVDKARKCLARIRCLKECVECLRSNSDVAKALPAALCYVPSQVEYRSVKNSKVVVYAESTKNSKKLFEFVCTSDHSVFIRGEELCTTEGQWGQLIKVTLKDKEISIDNIGGNQDGTKWTLLCSSDPSATHTLLPYVPEGNLENKGQQTSSSQWKLSSWEEVIEHKYALHLSKHSCNILPPDGAAVEDLQKVLPGWDLGHDEDLAQFLFQNIEVNNSILGSIKDYVESVDVSTQSDDDGPQNLTDGSADTYWETDGSQGQHWIRMKMKKGTVIKKLLLTIDTNDDNYVPCRMLVMGGELHNLRKLNEVSVDTNVFGVNDVLVLSDQTEHLPYIEVRIKECKDDGIDTRIHGIKIRSSRERDLGLNRDLFGKDRLSRFPKLESFTQETLYRRALVLLRLMRLLDSVLPYLVPLWEYSTGSYASLETIRQLLPLSQKRMNLVDQFLRESETCTPPSIPKLYINRRAAMEHKFDPTADVDYKNSIFTQMYEGLKPRDISEKPMDFRWSSRYEQWWECKFLAEGIIDQGGGFRDSLSDLSEELCPSNCDDPIPIPFFVRTPNQKSMDSNNHRDMYIPNPTCTEFHKYEWIGKMMGACFRSKEYLVLSLPSFIWKMLSGQQVTWTKDFVSIDEMEVKLTESMSTMDEASYVAYFGEERTWTTTLSNGSVVQLKPDGQETLVAYADRMEYCQMVQTTRMNESKKQVQAIQKGLFQVIPQAAFELLTWQELEKRICGDPEITMDLLRKYTHIDDMDKDELRVKFFWEALENFSNEDRSRFVRFVTGRRRLPVQIHVFSSDLSDILPSSSTCANTLFLPNFSSSKICEQRLRYAIYNCIAIDTDLNVWEE